METKLDLMPYAVATFAGGCFWCMQQPFDNLKGVVKTEVGYTGGHKVNPTYEEVCSETTGHAEAVRVNYDPAVVDYNALLDVFWMNIDPTTVDGQFADRGTQYRTAIFYHGAEQKKAAEKSKAKLVASGKFDKPIVKEITAASVFYPAENHHQSFYQKNAAHYQRYKIGSGRDGFIKRMWGDDKGMKK